MPRPELSQQPAAIRKRNQRARQRARTDPGVTVHDVTPAPSSSGSTSTQNGSAPAAAVFETKPVTFDGPDAYPLPPEPKDQPSAALVAPVTAAPTVTTEAEAKVVADMVRGFVGLGWGALLVDHQAQAVLLMGPPAEQAKKLAGALTFVEDAAVRVCVNRNINFRYLDEIVVAGALGTSAFGLFGGKKKKPVNENVSPAEAGSSATLPASQEPRQPPPPAIDPDDLEARAARVTDHEVRDDVRIGS